jgi:hypothetical protein
MTSGPQICQPRVDAARVRVDELCRFRIDAAHEVPQCFFQTPPVARHEGGAHVNVGGQGDAPEDLAQTSFGDAPKHVHLPKTGLRGQVALHEQRRLEVVGKHVRHPEVVKDDVDRAAESFELPGLIDRHAGDRVPSAPKAEVRGLAVVPAARKNQGKQQHHNQDAFIHSWHQPHLSARLHRATSLTAACQGRKVDPRFVYGDAEGECPGESSATV